MLFDFCSYLYNIKNNNVYTYFDCYSTFIMTKYDFKENILKHRMNFLINYYIQNKNAKIENINVLRDYYIRNYKDEYLLKPLIYQIINDNDNKNNENNYKNDNNYEEERDDDVEEHYKHMFVIPPPPPVIDYDELDKKYYEELKIIETKVNDDYDYYDDEYYDDEYCEIDNIYDEIDDNDDF